MATRYNFFGGLVTDGMILDLDAANLQSYPAGGTGWIDISGNRNNAELLNSPTFTGVSKMAAINFDGTDDYGVCPVINLLSNGSVAVWFNRRGNGTPDAGNVVDILANLKNDGTVGWSAGLNVSTNKLDFYIANNGGYGVENMSSASILTNTWYYAVFTYNGTTKTIYVNGAIDSSFSSTVNGTSNLQWGIATRVSDRRYFQGLISNSALYKRSISAFEVWQNFNSYKSRYGIPDIVTNGLVMNLDAGNPYSYYSPTSGTTWTDVSGNGNNGALTNGASYNNGGIVFDGTDDYVTGLDGVSLNTNQPFSVAIWFNITAYSDPYPTLIQLKTNTPSGWNMSLNNNNSSYLGVVFGSENTWSRIKTDNPPTSGTWNYVTVTYDGGGSVITNYSVYLNTVAQTLSIAGAFSPTTQANYIGTANAASRGIDEFNGKISNVKVYNRALSPSEITQNFNAFRGRYGV